MVTKTFEELVLKDLGNPKRLGMGLKIQPSFFRIACYTFNDWALRLLCGNIHHHPSI